MGPLLPVSAKEGFETRPALATGMYTTGIQIGAVAAIAPAALGGLRDLTGSFSGALWALVATAAVLVLATRALARRG